MLKIEYFCVILEQNLIFENKKTAFKELLWLLILPLCLVGYGAGITFVRYVSTLPVPEIETTDFCCPPRFCSDPLSDELDPKFSVLER